MAQYNAIHYIFKTSKSELGGSSKSNDCAICNPIKIQIRQLVDDIDEALGRVSHVKKVGINHVHVSHYQEVSSKDNVQHRK